MKRKKVSTTDEIARKRQRRSVRPYRVVSLVCVMLFLSLAVYMVYFQISERDNILNSPYNKRTEQLAEKVTRGSILAADGTVLARTDVDAEGNETRVYPYNDLFAHTVGYLDYGSSGLESSQNSVLLSSHADLTDQVSSDIRDEKKKGDNVVTTLNVNLQQAASDALGDNHGAVFVMDADSGDVLADVSKPGFNPNTIVQDWSTLTSEENESSGVFVNRATQGLYPPGSTFKIVTALAYLRQYGSFDNFTFRCTGSYENSGYTIHCAGNKAHGEETFADAMANSCNCAFASMAVEKIDKKVLRETAEDLGFNQSYDLELPSSKSRFTLGADTANQLTMQTGIGQGETLATPMQMCMIADAVANGGTMMEPKFISRIENTSGAVVKTMNSKSTGTVMSAEEAEQLTTIMKAVVQNGTASTLSDLPYDIAGKTGTAQYGDVSEGKAHSWFTGFSNTGSGDIVVCVLIEDGGNGNAPAVDAAKQIFQKYFAG
jgi:peptidoglycan glycosyltransferase